MWLLISLGCELKLYPDYGALQEVSKGGMLGPGDCWDVRS